MPPRIMPWIYQSATIGIWYDFRMQKFEERKARAKKIVAYLKKTYPEPKSELNFKTPFQFLAAVIMSAQCTDKAVNRMTESLYKKYKTPKDFANADLATFTKEISSVTFFNNKAKAVIGAAKMIVTDFKGKVPNNAKDLQKLPGVAYKTANVVMGDLYGIYEGIPTDTHVKRFAKRFDLVDSDDLTKISKELEALIPKKEWIRLVRSLCLYCAPT
jgi:endonuclease-3